MNKESINYVVGFVFSHERDLVLLIRKNKPAWQRGRLNGVGGKIEEGEKPVEAMKRECREETELSISKWYSLCRLAGDGWIVHFFWAFTDYIDLIEARHVECNEGTLEVIFPKMLPHSVLPNLQWLIPLALSGDAGIPLDIFENGVL